MPRHRQCGARRRASRCRRSRSRRRSVDPAIDDEQLATLHAAGVRAVRFNFIKRLVEAAPKEASLRVAERVARLGWHVVVYFEASGLEELTPFLRALPTTVVVDHMGRPDVSKDVADAGFQRFVALFRDDDRFWVKVSCPERLTRTGPPYDDVVPFARALVERFPDRVLWGTDWPHPNMRSHMPDDGALVDFIPRIAPDTASRLALLVDNPLRLYWQ